VGFIFGGSMKKSLDRKAPKAVAISNKILDILEVIIAPIHHKAVTEQCISKNEVGEVFTVAKLVKDIAAFAESADDNELENLTDEELRDKLKEYAEDSPTNDEESTEDGENDE
jgi:hypothetical protein